MNVAEFRQAYGDQLTVAVAAVKERLAALPDTADGIAAHLQGAGVTGVCGNPARCAIAEYLVPVLPEGWALHVSGGVRVAPVDEDGFDVLDQLYDDIDWNDDYDSEHEEKAFAALIGDCRILTGLAVQEFITKFDRHTYPALEAPA